MRFRLYSLLKPNNCEGFLFERNFTFEKKIEKYFRTKHKFDFFRKKLKKIFSRLFYCSYLTDDKPKTIYL